jgi:hypothetical protein
MCTSGWTTRAAPLAGGEREPYGACVPDVWSASGAVLDDSELTALKPILDEESPVIVEHRFYRGGTAPHRFVVDDYDELVAYVRRKGRPGDSFYFWVFERCCPDAQVVVHGKLPDAEGRVPVGGAY